jgi:hypothetical protein
MRDIKHDYIWKGIMKISFIANDGNKSKNSRIPIIICAILDNEIQIYKYLTIYTLKRNG